MTTAPCESCGSRGRHRFHVTAPPTRPAAEKLIAKIATDVGKLEATKHPEERRQLVIAEASSAYAPRGVYTSQMVDMSLHDVSGVVGWCLGALL